MTHKYAAADRIEELEAKLAETEATLQEERSATWKLLETPYKLAFEDCEAKLAKAVEALVRIADTPSEMTWGEDSEVREAMNGMEIIAETTLAELKGEQDG